MYSAVHTLEHGGLSACAVETAGATLYTAGRDGAIRAWDLTDGHCVFEWTGPDRRTETLAAPDIGQLVSAGDGGDISLWDSEIGQRTEVFRGHDDVVTDLDVGANGSMLVSVSYDRTLRRWKRGGSDGPELTVPTDKKLVAVALSPDRSVVAFGGVGSTAQLWAVDSNAMEATLDSHEDAVVSVGFTTGGSLLLTIDHGGRIRWWDRTTWEVVAEHGLAAPGDYPLAISTETVAVGTDRGISLFDPEGELRSELAIDVGVTELAIARDGSVLVAGTYDGRALVFRIADST
jgi:WD40 repeat protein